jgi:hypothetical protein
MPTECTHTLASGAKCQAPSRTGGSFCHHHTPRTHLDPHPRETRESEPLNLPPLLDKCAILVAVSEIVHAASERRIKCSEARTLLMALKFASRLMTEIDDTRFSSPTFESAPYSESTQQNTPLQPAQSPQPAPGQPHQPTASELDGFVRNLQKATFQQLHRQAPEGAEDFRPLKRAAQSSRALAPEREALTMPQGVLSR